jgi:hypothetical protein
MTKFLHFETFVLFVDNLAQRRRAGVRQLFHGRGNRGTLPCGPFFLCSFQLALPKGITESAATVEVSSLLRYYVDSQIDNDVSKCRVIFIIRFELSKNRLESLNLKVRSSGILS